MPYRDGIKRAAATKPGATIKPPVQLIVNTDTIWDIFKKLPAAESFVFL